MKKIKNPRNTFELALLREQLTYDVRLQEQALGAQAIRMKASFAEMVKNTAIIQTQKLAIHFLMKLMDR